MSKKMNHSIIYDNLWFKKVLPKMYEHLKFRKIHMGVADKLLFKKIALEEIDRLSLDKNPQRPNNMTPLDCAICDGLVNALSIYEKSYLKNL